MQILRHNNSYPMTARAFAFFSGLADGKPLVEVAFRGLDRYYLSTQLRRKYISRLASSSVAAAERTATLLVGNKISLTNEERKKLEDTVEASGNPSAIHLLLVYGTPLNSSKLISTFPFACLNPFDFFPYLLSRDLRVKYQEGLLSEKEAEAEWLSRLSRMAFDILMKYDCGHDPGGLLYVFTRQGSIENARLLLQSPHLADNLKDFIKKYMRGTFSEK